jgi:hypothetical protein
VFAASLTGNAATPNLSWDRDAFPDPSSPTFPVGTLAPFSVDPRDRTPYVQQWNLSMERSLARNLLLEVAYAGNKGTKLAERVNINQAHLPDPSNISPILNRRPYPGLASQFCGFSKKESEARDQARELAGKIVATRAAHCHTQFEGDPPVPLFLRFGSILGPFRRIFAGKRKHRLKLCGERRTATARRVIYGL